MRFNYAALLGLMREQGYTQERLAMEAHMSQTQLNAKLKSRYPFKQTDIQGICNVLGIEAPDIGHYFFTV